MKIQIPREFSPNRREIEKKRQIQPLRVLSSIPRPLKQQEVMNVACFDSEQTSRYLPFKQHLFYNKVVEVDYLQQLSENNETQALSKNLKMISVPIKIAELALNNIFEELQSTLLKMPDCLNHKAVSSYEEVEVDDFYLKCEQFDRIEEDLIQEMYCMHEEMETQYHTITLIHDIKYKQICDYLNNEQIAAEKFENVNNYRYIEWPSYSVNQIEFDYEQFKFTKWPNNEFNTQNLERILNIRPLNQELKHDLLNNLKLEQQPYKDSLDDVYEFLFDLEEIITGEYTFRRETMIKKREMSELFFLSLIPEFEGSINRYFVNNQQKVSFLQSLFGKDLFLKVNNESNELENGKLSRYSEYFVNFDEDFPELRANEALSIRNKYNKINYSECILKFHNREYLDDFVNYYNRQLQYYSIKYSEEFTQLDKIEYLPIGPFFEQYYKNNYCKENTSAYNEYVRQYQENEEILVSGVLDLEIAEKYNYHRSNLDVEEDICDLEEMNKNVQLLCKEQHYFANNEIGLLNELSSDTFSRVNYSFQVLKRSSAETQSTLLDMEELSDDVKEINEQAISEIEESSSESSKSLVIKNSRKDKNGNENNTPLITVHSRISKQQKYRLLEEEDLDNLEFKSKISTIRASAINFNHYFYSAINISKWPNIIDILNEFFDFSDKLSNIFKISVGEIMRKIIETNYWSAICEKAEQTQDFEEIGYLRELREVIDYNTHLKSIGDYKNIKVTCRSVNDIMMQDNLFETERVETIKLMNLINLRIQDTITELIEYICKNIISPFVQEFIGVFFNEVFSCEILSIIESDSTAKLSNNGHQIVVEIVDGMKNILDELFYYVNNVFKSFKEIKLINSYVLHSQTFRPKDVSITIEEAENCEDQLLKMLTDCGLFIDKLRCQNQNIIIYYLEFKQKYALDVEGICFSNFLNRII